MSNALTKLLECDAVARTVEVYERTFDDFMTFAGGRRIEEICSIPSGTANADYLVETEAIDHVVELMQVNAYEKSDTVDRYFGTLLRKGQVRYAKRLSVDQVRIGPSSLTTS